MSPFKVKIKKKKKSWRGRAKGERVQQRNEGPGVLPVRKKRGGGKVAGSRDCRSQKGGVKREIGAPAKKQL